MLRLVIHPRLRSKAEGLGSVHSVTIDGHKLGQLPYPNGAILFRDRGWMYEIMHEAPYLMNLAPTIEGSRPGSHAAALWAAIQDLGKTGRYIDWMERLFQFTDRLVSAFKQTNRFQILHDVDLTTVAVAPRAIGGETRTQLNQLAERLHCQMETDATEKAYLVNIDRGLSGIKVFNSNRRPTSTADQQVDSLVDIYCLRMVAANPIVDPDDAVGLVAYLEKQLDHARGLS